MPGADHDRPVLRRDGRQRVLACPVRDLEADSSALQHAQPVRVVAEDPVARQRLVDDDHLPVLSRTHPRAQREPVQPVQPGPVVDPDETVAGELVRPVRPAAAVCDRLGADDLPVVLVAAGVPPVPIQRPVPCHAAVQPPACHQRHLDRLAPPRPLARARLLGVVRQRQRPAQGEAGEQQAVGAIAVVVHLVAADVLGKGVERPGGVVAVARLAPDEALGQHRALRAPAVPVLVAPFVLLAVAVVVEAVADLVVCRGRGAAQQGGAAGDAGVLAERALDDAHPALAHLLGVAQRAQALDRALGVVREEGGAVFVQLVPVRDPVAVAVLAQVGAGVRVERPVADFVGCRARGRAARVNRADRAVAVRGTLDHAPVLRAGAEAAVASRGEAEVLVYAVRAVVVPVVAERLAVRLVDWEAQGLAYPAPPGNAPG